MSEKLRVNIEYKNHIFTIPNKQIQFLMYNNPKTFKPFKNYYKKYLKVTVDINYGEVNMPQLPDYNVSLMLTRAAVIFLRTIN